MTMKQKRGLAGVSSVLAILAILAAVSVFAARSSSAGARSDYRIELVAECMTFRLADDSADDVARDNPPLEVRTGRRVTVLLRGADPGMKHDFAIPQLQLQTTLVALDETATLAFTAPAPGTYDYLCTRHSQVMRGLLIVTP
jgi:heme/copper-type cytochrome/quinol oxidase subunit 2